MLRRSRAPRVSAICACLLFACTTDRGSTPDAGDGSTPFDATAPADLADGPTMPPTLIHYLGRFDGSDPAGPRFAYPGSAITTTFTGTGLDVMLSDTGQNYFDVVVDGKDPITIMTTGSASYALAKNLSAGTHTVTLTKITESFQGIVQLLSFTPHGGSLVPSAFPFSRRIEMIGDSITCGYGVLGAGPSCDFSPATEDEDMAWGALAAKSLDAMHTAIAYSGKGMFRNSDGSTDDLMPQIWERTFADDATSTWDTAGYRPDVVVINLGTNDFAGGDPGSGFPAAYTAFLGTLRTAYPDAYIVCVLGPMLDGTSYTQAEAYIQGVVQTQNSMGDAKVSFLALGTQLASDGYGCNYHPSPTTHMKTAAELASHISTLTGW